MATSVSGMQQAPASSGGSASWMNNLFPGAAGLAGTASANIGELLNGNPSTSAVRSSNAMFGAASGQPGSGDQGTYIGNRGADLYGQQSQAMKQQGLTDLGSTMGTFGGLGLQNQQIQNQASQFSQNLAQNEDQFKQSLAQQGSQFGQNMGLQQQQLSQQNQQFNQSNAISQYMAQLQALGLIGNLVSTSQQVNQ